MSRGRAVAVLLLGGGQHYRAELPFVRHMDCAAPLDELDEASKCVSLQWATSGSEKNRDNVGRGRDDTDLMAEGGWLGVISFQSVVSNVHSVWANIAVPQKSELRSPLHNP